MFFNLELTAQDSGRPNGVGVPSRLVSFNGIILEYYTTVISFRPQHWLIAINTVLIPQDYERHGCGQGQLCVRDCRSRCLMATTALL